MKKIIALLATALFITSAACAAVPVIEKVEMESRSLVEVDFAGRVQYENAAVTVTSENGEALTAEIVEMDDDDMTFRVDGLTPSAAYSFEISGIRAGGEGAYETVSGAFETLNIPEGIVDIRKIEYDAEDSDLEIEFDQKVDYENVAVTVENASGAVIDAVITEKDADDLEIRLGKTVPGESYTVRVSGIGPKDSGTFGEVFVEFTAK